MFPEQRAKRTIAQIAHCLVQKKDFTLKRFDQNTTFCSFIMSQKAIVEQPELY